MVVMGTSLLWSSRLIDTLVISQVLGEILAKQPFSITLKALKNRTPAKQVKRGEIVIQKY